MSKALDELGNSQGMVEARVVDDGAGVLPLGHRDRIIAPDVSTSTPVDPAMGPKPPENQGAPAGRAARKAARKVAGAAGPKGPATGALMQTVAVTSKVDGQMQGADPHVTSRQSGIPGGFDPNAETRIGFQDATTSSVTEMPFDAAEAADGIVPFDVVESMNEPFVSDDGLFTTTGSLQTPWSEVDPGVSFDPYGGEPDPFDLKQLGPEAEITARPKPTTPTPVKGRTRVGRTAARLGRTVGRQVAKVAPNVRNLTGAAKGGLQGGANVLIGIGSNVLAKQVSSGIKNPVAKKSVEIATTGVATGGGTAALAAVSGQTLTTALVGGAAAGAVVAIPAFEVTTALMDSENAGMKPGASQGSQARTVLTQSAAGGAAAAAAGGASWMLGGAALGPAGLAFAVLASGITAAVTVADVEHKFKGHMSTLAARMSTLPPAERAKVQNALTLQHYFQGGKGLSDAKEAWMRNRLTRGSTALEVDAASAEFDNAMAYYRDLPQKLRNIYLDQSRSAWTQAGGRGSDFDDSVRWYAQMEGIKQKAEAAANSNANWYAAAQFAQARGEWMATGKSANEFDVNATQMWHQQQQLSVMRNWYKNSPAGFAKAAFQYAHTLPPGEWDRQYAAITAAP